ncbi:MAG: hypothetical protein V8T87_03650 [Victivallales bacterium]
MWPLRHLLETQAPTSRAGKTLARWAGDLDFVELCTSIEIPYANAREFALSADDWRSFGARRRLGAFVRYFR